MTSRFVLCCALALAPQACTLSSQRSTDVQGPSGSASQLIECTGDAAACYRKASALCPEGYRLEANGMSEKVWGGENNSAVGSVTVRELLVTCTDAGSQQMSEAEPPTGAGGFLFGDDISAVEQACSSQGFRPATASGNHFCSGVHPGVGVSGITYLTLCAGKLCEVDMMAPIPNEGDDAILKRWRDLKWKISQRYGSPYDQELVTTLCRGRLRKCIATGEGAVHMNWRWRTGHVVSIHMVSNEGDPVIRIIYSAPKVHEPSGAPAL